MNYNMYPCTLNTLEVDIVKSTHALIAGAAGSGKSVLIRRVLRACAAMGYSTVLLDPKGCELKPWRNCINTLAFAEYPDDIIRVLEQCVQTIEDRFHNLPNRCRDYNGPHIWVVVDEYADLVLSRNGKKVQELCQRISQKGRAAGVHLLIATQRPTAKVVDGAVKVNITTRIALHCANRQDSRNILERSGAELLPEKGQCYFLRDSGHIDKRCIPMLTPREEWDCVDFMEAQRYQERYQEPRRKRFAWKR